MNATPFVLAAPLAVIAALTVWFVPAQAPQPPAAVATVAPAGAEDRVEPVELKQAAEQWGESAAPYWNYQDANGAPAAEAPAPKLHDTAHRAKGKPRAIPAVASDARSSSGSHAE